MNVLDIIYNQNLQMSEKELIPLLEKIDELDINKKDLDLFIEELEIDPKDIYFVEGRLPHFMYYKFPNYCEFYSLDLKDETMLDIYKKKIYFQSKTYEEKSWTKYILSVDGAMKMHIFTQIFSEIPDEDKYEYLKSVYIEEDQGHHLISQEIWQEALANKSSNMTNSLPGKQIEYTVFRGVGSKSTNITETLSWSLDLNVAIKFACRGEDKDISIFKAKVNKNDIVDYFTERNEQEIIVKHESLYDIEEIKQYKISDLFGQLTDNHLIEEYQYYANTFIDSDNFRQVTDLHGERHSKRVLLFVLALSYLLQLDTNDRAILANVAMYHDIGREHDGIDDNHGSRSWEQLLEKNIHLLIIDCQNKLVNEPYTLRQFSPSEINLIKQIIIYHNKDDSIALSPEEHSLNQKEFARYNKLITIFKDADALDRYRIFDIDDSYIRLEETRKLYNFSQFALSNIM